MEVKQREEGERLQSRVELGDVVPLAHGLEVGHTQIVGTQDLEREGVRVEIGGLVREDRIEGHFGVEVPEGVVERLRVAVEVAEPIVNAIIPGSSTRCVAMTRR